MVQRKIFFLLSLTLVLILSLPHLHSQIKETEVQQEVYEDLEKEKLIDATIILSDVDAAEKEANKLSKQLNTDYKFSTFNAISAQISAEDLENLKKNPYVEKIEVEPEMKIFLQDSIHIINASLVWPLQENKVNLTGKNEAICILDSGVNYAHSEFGCGAINISNSSCKVIGGYDFVNNDADPLDDHGHGTFVAGIISRVAPSVKIVSVKVCSSGGSCNNIAEAIDFCVNNSAQFNISVISMSLGTTTLFSGYCDSAAGNTADTIAVNTAIAKNISVIAAAGNDGSSSAIASPACIKNVTAVGATTKNDGIIYNRNNLTDLLAPGQSINSTWLNGYITASGTSASVPHVSASFALLRSYFRNRGIVVKPSELESSLKSTGVQVYDSSSRLNFSRISIKDSLLNLDTHGPLFDFSFGYLISNASNSTGWPYGFELNVTVSDIRGVINSSFQPLIIAQNLILISTEILNDTFSRTYVINVSGLSHNFHKLTTFVNDSANIQSNKSFNFAINYYPISILNINQTFPEDTNLTINLSNYFIDFDNDTLIYSCSGNNSCNMQCESSGNLLKIIPKKDFNGACSLAIDVNDTFTITKSNLSLNVTPVADFHVDGFNISQINLSLPFNLSINKTFGTVNFSSVNLSYYFLNGQDLNLSSFIEISQNRIFVNSNVLPELNVSAVLILSGLSFTNPILLRNSQTCESSICQLISYQNGILLFNVSSFSTYSASENASSGASGSGSGSSGGGGGGGGTQIETQTQQQTNQQSQLCIESWFCNSFSSCVNGKQTRTCVDINNCGTTARRPALEQSCEIKVESKTNQSQFEQSSQPSITGAAVGQEDKLNPFSSIKVKITIITLVTFITLVIVYNILRRKN